MHHHNTIQCSLRESRLERRNREEEGEREDNETGNNF